MKSDKPSVHFPRLVASNNETNRPDAGETVIPAPVEEEKEEKFDTFFNSSNRIVMTATIVILAGFVALLVFAFFAPIHRGAVAQGRLQRLGQHNVIQHLDGGVVDKILVKEGDQVTAGQLLVKLDERTPRLALNLLQEQQRLLLIEQAELQAERAGQSGIQFPAPVLQHAGDISTAHAMQTAMNLLATRRMSRDQRKAVLREENARLQSHADGLGAQKSGLIEQARLIRIEAESLTELYDKGLTTRTRILALQRSAADIQGSVGSTEASIQQDKVQVGENNLRVLSVDQDMQEEDAKRLTELQTQLFELDDRIASQALTVARTSIVAPFDGTVLNRAINSPGMVIRPGEPILEIVRNDQLIVRANVKPQDIERVHVGAKAVVRMSSLNVQTTPRLDGKVIYVSADALTDKEHGVSYYEAEVEVSPSEMKKLDHVHLTPGMPAEIMIDAGSRTMLSYLLQPVAGAFGRAFTE